MKRFIISTIFVTVFFLGLGALMDKTGAKYKSDAKALELIAKARQAIGGDAAINNVQSLSIIGRTTRNFKIDGVDKSEEGETEIAMQLPDKLMKMMKVGHDDGKVNNQMIHRQVEVTVVGNDKDGKKIITGEGRGEGFGSGAGVTKKIIVKNPDGTTQELTGPEAEKWIAGHKETVDGAHRIIIKKPDGTAGESGSESVEKVIVRTGDELGKEGEVQKKIDGGNVIIRRGGAGEHGESAHEHGIMRFALGLLLSSPKGMDVDYTYGGEGSVDGTACDIVVASFGGRSVKLYLDHSSSMPVMISYTGVKMPDIMTFKTKSPEGSKGENPKENMVFTRKVDATAGEKAEFDLKFSDYRSVNGVMLPFRWVQTVGDTTDETFDVTSYEINPANIADKFNNDNVKVRVMKKPDSQ